MSETLHAFARYAARNMSEQAARHKDKTGRGGAADWSDYRYRVGYAAGIEEAAKILNGLVNEYMRREDA